MAGDDDDITDTVGYQLGQAMGPQARGCLVAAFGFAAFIISPLWAIASSQSLPAGQEDRGYEFYFFGLGAGLVAGIVLTWDTRRRLRDRALRRPMKKSTFSLFWVIGYAGSSFVEREVAGTLWGPFFIGAFGVLALLVHTGGFDV